MQCHARAARPDCARVWGYSHGHGWNCDTVQAVSPDHGAMVTSARSETPKTLKNKILNIVPGIKKQKRLTLKKMKNENLKKTKNPFKTKNESKLLKTQANYYKPVSHLP